MVLGITALGGAGLLIGHDQFQYTVSHPECDYFGSQRERYVDSALRAARGDKSVYALSDLTDRVTAMLASKTGDGRRHPFGSAQPAGSIDSYIKADFTSHGITPAPPTTDWEFIRRVTLDLTGRIPTPDRVLTFVTDTTPDKRAKLIDELLAKPEWADK